MGWVREDGKDANSAISAVTLRLLDFLQRPSPWRLEVGNFTKHHLANRPLRVPQDPGVLTMHQKTGPSEWCHHPQTKLRTSRTKARRNRILGRASRRSETVAQRTVHGATMCVCADSFKQMTASATSPTRPGRLHEPTHFRPARCAAS